MHLRQAESELRRQIRGRHHLLLSTAQGAERLRGGTTENHEVGRHHVGISLP